MPNTKQTESIDIVREAQELLARATRGPLTLIRYEHGGGRLIKDVERTVHGCRHRRSLRLNHVGSARCRQLREEVYYDSRNAMRCGNRMEIYQAADYSALTSDVESFRARAVKLCEDKAADLSRTSTAAEQNAGKIAIATELAQLLEQL